MATRMLQRRGTAAEWAAANPVLGDGEVGVERDTGIIKIGDGVTAWASLTNEYIRKSAMDAAYLNRNLIDAAGDLLVGSADNTATRLAKGTEGQRLTIDGSGNLVWQDLPVAANPFTAIDALGDILVGSGPDAVARLAKGANGQVLTIDGSGNVTWSTPSAVDSSKVAKAGDTMTGVLKFASTNGVRFMGGAADSVANDVILYTNPTGGEVHVRAPDLSAYRPVRAGAVYDSGNRVYSASNPPPASGAMINQTMRGSISSQWNGSSYPATTNLTISSVNMAKTQLRLLSTNTLGQNQRAKLRLTSSTNIEHHQNANTTVELEYELTEWT